MRILGIGQWIRTYHPTVNRTHKFTIFTCGTRPHINLKPIFSHLPRWERLIYRPEFVFLLLVENQKFCISFLHREAWFSEILFHQPAIQVAVKPICSREQLPVVICAHRSVHHSPKPDVWRMLDKLVLCLPQVINVYLLICILQVYQVSLHVNFELFYAVCLQWHRPHGELMRWSLLIT